MFGKPREGVHAYRLLDFAVVDIGLTVGAAYLWAKAPKKYRANLSFAQLLLGLGILSILLHRLFCVRTKVDQLLFS